jgi:hypothetical protein
MSYKDRIELLLHSGLAARNYDTGFHAARTKVSSVAAEADAEIARLKQWRHYPIDMPLTAEGMGPATIGFDAASVIYEVWDENCTSYGAFPQLRQAIELAMRLNSLPENP